jgi:hypothetical protein
MQVNAYHGVGAGLQRLLAQAVERAPAGQIPGVAQRVQLAHN